MLPSKNLFYPVGCGYDGFGVGYPEQINLWGFVPDSYLLTHITGDYIQVHGSGDGYGDGYGSGWGDPTDSIEYKDDFGFGSFDGLGDGSETVSTQNRRR